MARCSPPRCLVLAGLLAPACAGRRAPAPVPAESAPASVSNAGPAPLRLHAAAEVPQTYGVAQPCDLVVPDELGVLRSGVWGTGQCGDQHCTLAHVQPGEPLELSAEAPVSTTVQALPLPLAHRIAPMDTLRLALQPVAPGDPRGPLADVQLTLDAPARISLEWHTTRDADTASRPAFVQTALYGPQGEVSAAVHGQYEHDPTRRSNTWDLPAGTHTLRITPWDDLGDMLCDPPAFPGLPPPAVPEWCALSVENAQYEAILEWTKHEPAEQPPAPDAPAPPALGTTLDLGQTNLSAGPPAPPSSHTVPVAPGQDVVVRWTPADVPLAYSWRVSEDHWSRGACEEGACRFAAVPFSELTLLLHPGPTDRTVDLAVDVLPPPEPAFELPPGHVASTQLARVAADDPRGPLVDFLAEFPAPGRYRVGVGWTEGEPRPSITLRTTEDGLQSSFLNVLGSAPYDAAFFDVSEPGLYPFRITSCPDCPDQDIEVEVQVEE